MSMLILCDLGSDTFLPPDHQLSLSQHDCRLQEEGRSLTLPTNRGEWGMSILKTGPFLFPSVIMGAVPVFLNATFSLRLLKLTLGAIYVHTH